MTLSPIHARIHAEYRHASCVMRHASCRLPIPLTANTFKTELASYEITVAIQHSVINYLRFQFTHLERTTVRTV